MMRVTACSLPVISGFVFLAVFLSWSVPLHAQDAQPATGQATTATVWRSDAALSEAEKMIQAGKYVDALTFLDQAISRNIRNIDAHVHTALVWYHLGNQEKARSALKSALMIDRNHIGAYVIAGMIALKEKKYTDARDYLGVIRVLCRSESCPEYSALQRMIRETPEEESRRWYHF